MSQHARTDAGPEVHGADGQADATSEHGGGDDHRTSWLKQHPYGTLGLAVGLHFVIMFSLTYVGVDALDDVFVNLNRFYMAVVMVAPMIAVMVLFMWHMFPDRGKNIALLSLSALLFLASFFAIRSQTFIGDQQFLRSMIPHHSVAIKTCERSDLSDPEIVELCDQIVQTQEEEIAQMRDILARLD